jgi:serine/threonine protein kinase
MPFNLNLNLCILVLVILIPSLALSVPVSLTHPYILKRAPQEIPRSLDVNGQKYQVHQIIGKGLEGSVYLSSLDGMDPEHNLVVIKKYHQERPGALTSFLREEKALNFLGRLKGSDTSDLLIISDYINGDTFKESLKRATKVEHVEKLKEMYDQFVKKSFISKSVNGEWYTLIDSDIRPGNIMVTLNSQNQPELHHIDFGFAQLIPQSRLSRLQVKMKEAKKNAQKHFKDALMSVLAARALENPLSPDSKAFVDAYVHSRLEKNQPVTEYLKAWDIVNQKARRMNEHSSIPKSVSQVREPVTKPRTLLQYALHL